MQLHCITERRREQGEGAAVARLLRADWGGESLWVRGRIFLQALRRAEHQPGQRWLVPILARLVDDTWEEYLVLMG